MKKILSLLFALTLVLCGCGLAPSADSAAEDADTTAVEETEVMVDDAQKSADEELDGEPTADEPGPAIDEGGSYTSKEEVARYLHTYGHLPVNYVTKDEAEDAGWKTEGLDLSEACPGKSIGGDRFGNREGLLPKASGRQYYECDIDYPGHGSRGPKRLVYSNDGLIYYTEDHYQTFELLYGEES